MAATKYDDSIKTRFNGKDRKHLLSRGVRLISIAFGGGDVTGIAFEYNETYCIRSYWDFIQYLSGRITWETLMGSLIKGA
jgi:hypothetical protein